jgi:hypothetical protein
MYWKRFGLCIYPLKRQMRVVSSKMAANPALSTCKPGGLQSGFEINLKASMAK